MQKSWILIAIMFAYVSCYAQYYRDFGAFFKQFKYVNQTRTIYSDTTNKKVYFLGEHQVHVPDSVDQILIEWDRDSLHSILTLAGNLGGTSNLSSIVRYKGKLYIGGSNFDFLHGREANILVYDNHTWDTLTVEPNGYVYKMIEHNGKLYMCGDFNKIGNTPCKGIAYMDSSGWHCIDSGLCSSISSSPFTINFYHDTLYMAGTITDFCHPAMNQLERYNGITWEAVPGWQIGNNSQLGTLIIFQDKLYVAGYFYHSDGISLGNNIVYYDGAGWYSPGAGVDNNIASAVIANNKLFVGGDMTSADGVPLFSFASWDGHKWCSLDTTIKTFQGALTMATLNDTIFMAGGGLDIVASDTFYYHGYWVGKNYEYECGQYYTGIQESNFNNDFSIFPQTPPLTTSISARPSQTSPSPTSPAAYVPSLTPTAT